MALKRSFLKGMNLTDEQIDSIIEAHSETVDALKNDLAKYKQDSEQLASVSKELESLKAKGDGGFEAKYNAEHEAFETYKNGIEAEKLNSTKKTELNKILSDAGIGRDSVRTLIGKSYDLSKIVFDDDGNIKDRDTLVSAAKTDYAEFIGEQQIKGAGKVDPPSGGNSKLTIDAIKKMTPAEINANWEAVSAALSNK